MNVNKLRGKIVEKGYNTGTLANKIGIDRSTLYRKMNNQGEALTLREVNLIRRELNLSTEEAIAIFFTEVVA